MRKVYIMKRKGKFQKKSSKVSIGILCISVALVVAISCSAAILLNRSDGMTYIVSNERKEAQSPVSVEPSIPTAATSSLNDKTNRLDLFVPLDISLHGTYVSKTTAVQTNSGISRKTESTLEWEDGSDSKEIMRKHIDLGGGCSREIMVYLGLSSYDHSVVIVSEYIENGITTKTKTFPAFSISTKNQCYIILENDYLAIVDKTEKTEGWYDGYYHLSYDIGANGSSQAFGWGYTERIIIYDIFNDLDEILSVTREMHADPTVEDCTLKTSDGKWTYASGYGSVSSSGSALLSTEQEFCDKANSALSEYFGDAVNVTRTSWENRWYRLLVNQDALPKSTLKIDSTASYGQRTKDDAVVSNIEICFNQKDIDHGELPEESPDVAVVYTQPPATTEPVYWPSYIPKSVDKSQLQNLIDFNLDGFWHSTDGQHVYHIDTKSFSLSPLHYIDLKGSDEVKSGNVVQTSSFGLTLKAGGDRGAKFEVVAANDQLISDEITLLRTEDYIVNRLLGTWSNEDWSFTFKSDGTYHVSRTQGDSYWGCYFVVDDTRIVLTKTVHDCELREYRIDGNALWIDNWDALIH